MKLLLVTGFYNYKLVVEYKMNKLKRGYFDLDQKEKVFSGKKRKAP